MTTLHLVRQSAFNSQELFQCSQIILPADILVLIDDGCYNLNHTLLTNIKNIISVKNIKVIQHHVSARGLNVPEFIEVISMNELVNLTFDTENVITWQ
ncbi:sulfurtransferase complex subunit TusB [Litorilituus lipolyticus]|uniref:Sulfurtransferase complex subunit TusB n=1 Tax=Litorilituus lipolyticus TaxID=2491017 RepID=A0A502KRH6_9GAMM|nr:sulfurtransferase complex subunit TusB [Litorilituus lipolyticus]TPH12775.1 sulfurtransferase complex subunit TusB [Litorilituus lipolyticus]